MTSTAVTAAVRDVITYRHRSDGQVRQQSVTVVALIMLLSTVCMSTSPKSYIARMHTLCSVKKTPTQQCENCLTLPLQSTPVNNRIKLIIARNNSPWATFLPLTVGLYTWYGGSANFEQRLHSW